jgi:transposase
VHEQVSDSLRRGAQLADAWSGWRPRTARPGHYHVPIPGKLLIVWDGLPAHRSRLVWEFVRQQKGRLWLEFLPAYAPELNPVEYLWSYWKQYELPNYCPQNFGQLSSHARQALRRMRRPTLSALSGNRLNSSRCKYIM